MDGPHAACMGTVIGWARARERGTFKRRARDAAKAASKRHELLALHHTVFLATKKSRTLGLLSFDEKFTFDFLQYLGI
jgi:hypothetical protein